MAKSKTRTELDDIAEDYTHNRVPICTVAELVGWWHWAYRSHSGIYRQLVYAIEVEDSTVEMVRQRLLKHGH